jgi:tellurite resistance protein TehA-like permease
MRDDGSALSATSGGLADMHPAYFGVVMATGIVSIAHELLGVHAVALGLFALNVPLYLTIWTLTLARIVRHPDRVVADLRHHGRSVGFFTAVPSTSVLGSQFLIIGGSVNVALVLWGFACLLWGGLIYGILTILTVKQEKPALAEGINGGWLLIVVAAQSVAVLGAQLAPRLPAYQPHALLFCLAMWLGGGMLYFWIISLIFYRYTFFILKPSDLAPPYWINMGAAAISTVAGTTLVASTDHSPVLGQLLPFVRGFTVLWWATATWWIPMLVILSIWRHGFQRFPLRYDPLYWGAVFPLGMYTVATTRLVRAIDAPYLLAVPRVFVFVALAAWTVAMLGMMSSVTATLRRWAALRSGHSLGSP